MKNKRWFLLLIVVCVLVFALIFKRINTSSLAADSGFDSSWDSGGSDWGGSSSWDSDWGSSSYSRSHYNNSNSNSNVNISTADYIIFTLLSHIIVVILLIIIFKHTKNKQNNKHIKNANIKDNIFKDNNAALEEISKEIPGFNKEAFYDYSYKVFVDIQNAWMNFDYDTLRKLTTDELFNTYKSQLKTLEVKKQKNIMSNFTRSDIAIIKYNKSEDKHNIVVKMTARFFDYLVDKDNNVIRGSNERRIIISYYLTFVSSISNKPNKCPNCNAPLDNNSSSNICPYCNSTIISGTHEFILSKKEVSEQRME